MQAGKSSIQFEHPPIITSAASIVGQTEGEGPLASFFDRVEPDPTFGKSRGRRRRVNCSARRCRNAWIRRADRRRM